MSDDKKTIGHQVRQKQAELAEAKELEFATRYKAWYKQYGTALRNELLESLCTKMKQSHWILMDLYGLDKYGLDKSVGGKHIKEIVDQFAAEEELEWCFAVPSGVGQSAKYIDTHIVFSAGKLWT